MRSKKSMHNFVYNNLTKRLTFLNCFNRSQNCKFIMRKNYERDWKHDLVEDSPSPATQFNDL